MERGVTCSRRQYRSFLRRCLLAPSPHEDRGAASLWGEEEEEEEEGDDGWLWMNGEGGSSSLPSRPWEGLRLRVERGVR